ncbi:MAG: hypothetical protein J0L94_01425 [Rhodothermia bacterium]|mgnify:CR=1 FL=1|nr:hypothetical protein [Rhodothermia bacterium]
MKKELRIVPLHQQPSDFDYWKKQTAEARLEALHILRQRYLSLIGHGQGFQRVYRIVKRKSS